MFEHGDRVYLTEKLDDGDYRWWGTVMGVQLDLLGNDAQIVVKFDFGAHSVLVDPSLIHKENNDA